MAKITRIKAGDSPQKQESDAAITRKKVVVKDKKTDKIKQRRAKAAEKLVTDGKTDEKKPFIMIRPFVYLGRYLKNAWRELGQVRWPNRKATWKMVLAVIVYAVFFMAMILLLDWFFSWLFNLILGKG